MCIVIWKCVHLEDGRDDEGEREDEEEGHDEAEQKSQVVADQRNHFFLICFEENAGKGFKSN